MLWATGKLQLRRLKVDNRTFGCGSARQSRYVPEPARVPVESGESFVRRIRSDDERKPVVCSMGGESAGKKFPLRNLLVAE